MIFCVYDCLRRRMGGHTPTSDTLPRGSPPPHAPQQLTHLWCGEEIVTVKPDLGTLFFRQKRKSTQVKSGKDISYKTTPDHYMLAQRQLHTGSLETCMSDQGLGHSRGFHFWSVSFSHLCLNPRAGGELGVHISSEPQGPELRAG